MSWPPAGGAPQDGTRISRMSWDSSVSIAADQRWINVEDFDDVIVIEGTSRNRWLVRNVVGDVSELTGAQIRSGFRHAANGTPAPLIA